MKTNTISAICILLLSAAAVSCGPSAEEKAKMQAQREQETRDSIAKVETMKIEQQRQDSIRQAELKELYANAITIKVGNKSKTYSRIGEGYDVTLTCTVTNNTPIALTASDYSLSCTERYPRSSDGTVPDGYKAKSAKSVDLAPGASATVKFSAQCTEDLSSPKAKFNMSEEDFLKRVAEAGGTKN